MQAVRKVRREYDGMRLEERPDPACGAEDVIVRVTAAAVCGSDLHAYQYHSTHHYMQVPVTMGHECTGVIEQTGTSVSHVQVGDTVVADAILSCGSCEPCLAGRTNLCHSFEVRGMKRDGVFAEKFATPARFVHPISNQVPPAEAALAEPLAVAFHAAASVHPVSPGDVHLVTGPGPIGVLTALCLQLQGADVLLAGTMEDEEKRFPICEALGIPAVLSHPEPIRTWLNEHTGRTAVEGWVECSGAASVFDFIPDVVKKGGTCTVQGLYKEAVRIDMTALVRREVSILTSCAYTAQDMKAAIRLLEKRKVEPAAMIQLYRLEDMHEAFEDAVQQKVMKSVFLMGE
ncbi:alcohol dehydrogenase catalytic domain-containing protein [Alkalicoccus chagannorensis]